MFKSDDDSKHSYRPLLVESVSRSFEGLRAVYNVSFTVDVGERLAVLGPNGAGKSTLFNLICGDLAVDAGTVTLKGEDVTSLALHHRVRRGLARTYQTSSVFDDLTVREHLTLASQGPRRGRLSLLGRPSGSEARLRHLSQATRVGLAERLNDPASALSHGELRQLEVGMALAAEPSVVLLDEPAAGLSADERKRLTELLLNLEPDISVVLVEHDMDVALTVAERVLVLNRGAVVAEGTPDEIESDPLVQAIYLGEQHENPLEQQACSA